MSLKCFPASLLQGGGRRRLRRESGFRHLRQGPPLLQREERLGPAADDGGVGHHGDVRAPARRLPRELPGLQGGYLQVRFPPVPTSGLPS